MELFIGIFVDELLILFNRDINRNYNLCLENQSLETKYGEVIIKILKVDLETYKEKFGEVLYRIIEFD